MVGNGWKNGTQAGVWKKLRRRIRYANLYKFQNSMEQVSHSLTLFGKSIVDELRERIQEQNLKYPSVRCEKPRRISYGKWPGKKCAEK